MITTIYANTLTQIADNSMHALDVCGDMPDRINLAGSIESIDTRSIVTITEEAVEFIRKFDQELEIGFFTENDVLRNGYAVRTVEHLLNKWWPIYYVAGKTHEVIESAEMGLTISKIAGDHSIKLTELGAEVSTVLYSNRQTTFGLIVLFSGCISVTVKYVSRFSPHLLTQHLDKLGLFIKDSPASTNHPDSSPKLYAGITQKSAVGDPLNSLDVSQNNFTGLSHAQIAILYHYTGQPITRNNRDEIAKKYGQTSGQKLETVYDDLTSELIRTGKGKNRVKDIKTVLPLLTGSAKQMAEKELELAIKTNKK